MKLFAPLCFRATLAVTAMAGATAAIGQELNDRSSLNAPPDRVAHFANYGDTSISDVRLRGTVRNIDYSIAAARTDASIIFDISLAGRAVQLRFRKEDFPDIDLRTIREGVNSESEPHTLRFDVEFSELGGCFDAATTPKRLVVSFNVERRISASRLTAEGCELVWHELSFVETGPNIYSASVED